MIEVNYNGYVVVLSVAVSFMASFLTCNFCDQLRITLGDKDFARLAEGGLSIRHKNLLNLVAMAISLGGVGIWAMHFIGMHALTLTTTDGATVDVHYNSGVSFISLIAVLVTTLVGTLVSSYDTMFGKPKKEIIDTFLAHAQRRYSLREVQKISNFRLFWAICTQQIGTLLIGGVITGGGICLMHYLGLEALNFDGCIRWDYGVVAGSVFVAIIAATFSFWVLFRLLSIFPHKEILRIIASLSMALAVGVTLYTGMQAATFLPSESCSSIENKNSTEEIGHIERSSNSSFIAAIVAANLCLWIFIMYLFWDLRRSLQLKTRYLKQAESVLCITATQAMSAGTLPLVTTKFIHKHGLDIVFAASSFVNLESTNDSVMSHFSHVSHNTTCKFTSPVTEDIECGPTGITPTIHVSNRSVTATPTKTRTGRVVPVDNDSSKEECVDPCTTTNLSQSPSCEAV